jgi:hypothetical protein
MAVGLILLARHHPGDLTYAPRCAFYAVTGLRCPGCGLMRATHHLLQGEVGRAFHLNPLAPVLPLLFAWVAGVAFHGLLRGTLPHRRGPPVIVGWLVIATLLVLWAGRLVVDIYRVVVT